MKPDVSHDFVKDFMVKAAEHNCTVASTSFSMPLKIWPKIDLSSAFCIDRITPITMANCTRENLTMLRIAAKISLPRSSASLRRDELLRAGIAFRRHCQAIFERTGGRIVSAEARGEHRKRQPAQNKCTICCLHRREG
jgi:hypothetical protein